MDNSEIPLSQADMLMLRSFLSRIPASLTSSGVPPPTLNISRTVPAAHSAPSQTSSSVPPISASYQPASGRSVIQASQGASGGNSQTLLNNFPAFQGIRSLGSRVSRQIVDQQRRASAAATLPRQPTLQPRASRRASRGTAIAPPGVVHAPTMQSAIVTNEDGSMLLKLKVKVYPPTENTNDEIVLYRSYIDSFNTFLESHFLLQEYEVSLESTIADLVNQIADDMRNCPLQYEFSTRFPQGIVRHEALPLRLLGLTNRGRARPSDGQVHLQRMPVSGITAMSTIFGNGNFYANPCLCLEGNRFVIHFVVAHFPFSALLSSEGSGTGTRQHKCLSRRAYRQFPFDGYVDMGTDSIEPYESSGGETNSSDNETDSEDDSDEERTPTPMPSNNSLLQLNRVPTHLVPRSAVGLPRVSNVRSERNRTATTGAALATTTATPSTLPLRIWNQPWILPPVENRIENLRTIEDVVRYVAEASGDTSRSRFSIRGKNVQDLATKLRREIESAAALKDFSKILVPNREFIVEGDDNFTIRSLGSGIEAEVLFTAFSQLKSNPGQWFLPRVDDMASVAVMHTAVGAARLESHSPRLVGMYIFGALTALLMTQGVPPIPLSPLFLQFIIHNCDLHALHSAFVTEWHPELAATIKQWITAGPTGCITSFQNHFSAWHESQIGLFYERDEHSHNALAAEMLYRAVIGSEPTDHPEIQSFISGFKLPCANGFDFTKVLKSFSGGAELYLSLIWTSQIKSFNDLAPYIQYRHIQTSLAHHAFSGFPDFECITLQSILTQFLSSTGIPCPKKFNDAKAHFSDVIDLEYIEDPSFRSRMFCWAATGCPSFVPDSGDITVYLVGDNDINYGLPSSRDAMLNEGKISFKTCSRQVRIPASYFNLLSSGVYLNDPLQEPKTIEEAVDHWLLCEILNGIGGHSML